VPLLEAQPQTPAPPAKRPITISDAVSIFLQQNFQLVAARYDIDTAEAEKLTARLRPNPQVNLGFQDLPLDFSGSFLKEQQFSYGISQTFELGGKRRKRIDSANANSDVAQAQFQMVLWQLTNDLKKKFYTVLLDESLLKLAQENQKTFAETIKHTTELFRLGEISGLDLKRLEVEKLKFDTDVANSEKDYEVAVRDLRVTLGGDYRAMDIDVAGTLDAQSGTTTLFILNRDLTNAHNVEVNFQGNGPSRVANSMVLTGNDLKAFNSFESPQKVSPQAFSKPVSSGGKATLEIPPRSYVVVQWIG